MNPSISSVRGLPQDVNSPTYSPQLVDLNFYDYLPQLTPNTEKKLIELRGQVKEKAEAPISLFSTVKDTQKASTPEEINALKEKIEIIRNVFFTRNLDSVMGMPQQIQGLEMYYPLVFLIKELEEYKKTLDTQDSNEISKIDNAISYLKEGQRISIDLVAIRHLINSEQETEKKQGEEILKEMTLSCSKKLFTLKEGERMIIPGGVYGVYRHYMVYEFIRSGGTDEKPTFKIKVYNSGSGVENHSKLGLFNIFNKFRTYVIEDVLLENIINPNDPNDSLIYKLIEYKVCKNRKEVTTKSPLSKALLNFFKLPFNRALLGFFKSLPLIGDLSKEMKTMHDMKSLYRLINVSVLKNEAKTNQGIGHNIQKQESCTRKALNYLLKEEFLTEVNYLSFKVKATESSIKQLKDIHEAHYGEIKKISKVSRYIFHTSFVARFVFYLKNDISNESMIYLAEDVLKRRKKKLEQALTTTKAA
jgi:hypothetical protein